MSRRGPLQATRVVELAGIGPAQLGTMLLADLGADVTRIDRASDVPVSFPDEPCRELLGRGRRSVALDLKDPAGRDAALALIEAADVLVDPYRPGVCERLGIGPDVVCPRNPRLVFARMTGWGQEGPLSSAAGHDLNYIAVAGALGLMGSAESSEPPPVPLNLVGDFGGGGMLLAFGVLAALLERERSGNGQVLDAAMVDGVAALMTSIFQLRAMGLWHEERGRNWVQGGAPWYRPYRTADGRHVTVAALEGQFYAQLLERLGLDPADWPQWNEERWPSLTDTLAELFAQRTLGEWTDLFEGTDACFAPVLGLDEAAEHPQIGGRGTIVNYEGALQPAPVPRFSRTPGALAMAPPWPGQHSVEVLAEAGLDATGLLAAGAATAIPFTPSVG